MLRLKLRTALFTTALTLAAAPLLAQGPPVAAPGSQAAPAGARILGTVTAVSGDKITVQQEGASTGEISVALTPQTRLLRTAPGEKNLRNATPMQAADLAVGDRVLIRATGDPDHPSAGILVAMKQGDISQAHVQDSADWQRRGVSGIVQSADPAAGTITLRAQGGAAPLVIHTTPATVVRRYAPDSTSFADAHKAALADIHPDDQLRARGAKDATGTGIAAEEIVAGSFRNIAGTVLSTDPSASTISLTDLATKRPVTLHLEATTQLRKLPPEMAARMARRAASRGDSGGAAGATPPADAHPGEPSRGGAGETAMLLQRAPSITLADLKKGDAVMVVASGPGATQPTAITLISGVEPLLQGSPGASAGLFSASWNLNGGGGADAAAGEGAPQR